MKKKKIEYNNTWNNIKPDNICLKGISGREEKEKVKKKR